MTKSYLAKKIYEAAHLTGEFTLRSGQVSNEYFDKYQFGADPVLLREIAKQMHGLIPEGSDVLAGLEMGAIPLAAALAMESGMPAAYVRKQAKEYGTRRLSEGAEIASRRVLVIEDVVTTGGQIIESVRELRSRGATVDAVMCVILRNSAAIELLAAQDLRLIPLFTMEYIKQAAGAV